LKDVFPLSEYITYILRNILILFNVFIILLNKMHLSHEGSFFKNMYFT